MLYGLPQFMIIHGKFNGKMMADHRIVGLRDLYTPPPPKKKIAHLLIYGHLQVWQIISHSMSNHDSSIYLIIVHHCRPRKRPLSTTINHHQPSSTHWMRSNALPPRAWGSATVSLWAPTASLNPCRSSRRLAGMDRDGDSPWVYRPL